MIVGGLAGICQEGHHKHHLGIEVSVGHSFPDYDTEQSRWKGTFYPTFGITALGQIRLNEAWQLGYGLGFTRYALVNQGPLDKYVFDFAAPHVLVGIEYILPGRSHRESFIRTEAGVQLGYTETLVEHYPHYTVRTSNGQQLNYLFRPEIGIRRTATTRIKGKRTQLAFEVSAFFRYSLYPLGTAEFVEDHHLTKTSPSGHIIGLAGRLMLPTGTKKIYPDDGKERLNPALRVG